MTHATATTTCKTPWCAEHVHQIGVCEAAPIPAPGGEVRLCIDPDAGQFFSLYVKTEHLTAEELRAICYAGLAMAARAEADALVPAQRVPAVA